MLKGSTRQLRLDRWQAENMNHISLEQTKMSFWLSEAGSRGDKFITRGIIFSPEVMTSTGGISMDGGLSWSRVVMVIWNVARVWKLPSIWKIKRVRKMARVQNLGWARKDKEAGVFTGEPERRGLAGRSQGVGGS